jgi:acyl carrier protein
MDDRSLVRRAQLPLRSAYVAPRTPTEARLAAIWTEALSMDRVGVEDRYGDLGGDSFLATVIFTMISDAFQIDVRLTLLAQAPTIAALAPRLEALIEAGAIASDDA